jgi:hypothetical protein
MSMETRTICFRKDGEFQFLWTNIPLKDFIKLLDYMFDEGFKVTAISDDEYWSQKNSTPDNCHTIYQSDVKRFFKRAKEIV